MSRRRPSIQTTSVRPSYTTSLVGKPQNRECPACVAERYGLKDPRAPGLLPGQGEGGAAMSTVRKSFGGVTGKTMATDAELQMIRGYAVRPELVTAESVRVFTCRAASNRVDRMLECFSIETLHVLARTLPGKSVMRDHSYREAALGRVLTAKVVVDDGVHWVEAVFYVPVAGNEKLINDLETGVVFACSIAAKGLVKREMRDDQGEFSALEAGPDCEAIELSLVFLGAQYDAAVTKAAAGMTPAPKTTRSIWGNLIRSRA
jgi:hypothetical protein